MSPPDAPMIRFPCPCGYRFEVPIEQAASALQCPKCGRLNDVPTLSEINSLSDDGTVLLKDDAAGHPAPRRDSQVFTAFRRAHIDRTGDDVDLRPTYEDLADVGADPDPDTIPLAQDERSVAPARPKYDPVTGELIRPINLAKPAQAPPIPVAKLAHSLTYAAGDLRDPMGARRIFVQLFMPVNFIVTLFLLFFYFCFQILGFVLFVLLAMAGVSPAAAQLPLAFLLMGQYAKTVIDNGPDAKDELPRPLGSLSWHEDLWHPFVQMGFAIGACFVPTILCLKYLPRELLAVTILPVGLGLFFFPAALLTITTSGTSANLRPDRLGGVIRAAGGDYILSFFLFLVALPLFIFTIGGVWLIPQDVRPEWVYVLNHPALLYPMILLSILLMNFATWHLGIIYRRHHAHFPWVLQHHTSTRRQLEARRAAAVRARRRYRTPTAPRG